MNKEILIIAAFLGAVSVTLGAFGAHLLKSKLTPDALQVFETAVRYGFYHVFALITVGILSQYFPGTLNVWSGRFFLYGIILFSGSLYLLTYSKASGNQSLNWVGAITPFGGLCLITGWVLLALSIMKK